MQRIKLAKIYIGETIQHKCNIELHPINQVNRAIGLINAKKSFTYYTNNPEFIMTIFHYGRAANFIIDFNLNGDFIGDDIETVFKDLNRAFKIIETLNKE